MSFEQEFSLFVQAIAISSIGHNCSQCRYRFTTFEKGSDISFETFRQEVEIDEFVYDTLGSFFGVTGIIPRHTIPYSANPTQLIRIVFAVITLPNWFNVDRPSNKPSFSGGQL